jgi:hypothetical protein
VSLSSTEKNFVNKYLSWNCHTLHVTLAGSGCPLPYILCMGAMFSGSMSGSFAYVLKRKSHLVGQKSEEKQDEDDYPCQGPFNGNG